MRSCDSDTQISHGAMFGTFVSFGQSSGTIENFKLADLSANGSLFATRPTVFAFISERKELERRAKQLFAMIKSGKVKTGDDAKRAKQEIEDTRALGRQSLMVTGSDTEVEQIIKAIGNPS